MEHLFIQKNPEQPVLLLLHGTGGDERSLIPIAERLLADASILSVRGNVQEQGMNRFFARHAEGMFDLESLEKETDALSQTITDLADEYQLDIGRIILLGYSNGANIGAHMLLTRQTSLKYGVFFHVMELREILETVDQSRNKVWVSYGERDPMVSADNFERLLDDFEKQQATVNDFRTKEGHAITTLEVADAKKWLDEWEV